MKGVDGFITGMVTLLVQEIGEPAVRALVRALLVLVGKQVVQGHVDEWDAAEAAADATAEARLGPRP